MDASKEDELLLAELDDKRIKAQHWECITHSGFLDPRQRGIAFRTFGCRFWGGYEDAERTIAVFLPDSIPKGQDTPFADEEDDPLAVLRVSIAKGGKLLTHRDYLGSLLSLGIDRSVVGDIIVGVCGADIVIMKSMADYLLMNYEKAGRMNLSCSLHPCSEIDTGEVRTLERRDSVASLRLDNLVSSAFDLARGKAQEAIRQGLVFADGMQLLKQDAVLKEGVKLVLRGKGKARLKTIGTPTKKGRLPVVWEKYL